MRTVAIAFAVLVAGCGHSQSSNAPPPPPPAAATGEHGAVCECGEHHTARGTSCVAVACKAGLTCGYFCGMQGCDSTCLTDEEIQASHLLP